MAALKYQSPCFWIKNIPVYGELVLAPMDGYSDQPFRSLCREMGSALSYTEFINALDVLNGHPRLPHKLAFLESERPLVYQLYDSDPDRLLQAAILLRQRNPDIIDINMGCSVRSVSGRGAGAGLLRDPIKVSKVISTLTRRIDIPVTAKIRLGWDDDQRNYLAVGRAIEESGGALVAVHGRTRSQGYSGSADWDAIAELKQTLSIPVIANGDVSTVADIQRILSYTGCNAVMIGRAAMGNPWIFSRLDRSEVPLDLERSTMLRHLESMISFYGETLGMQLFRKHASRYLSPRGFSHEQRRNLLTAELPADFLLALDFLHL